MDPPHWPTVGNTVNRPSNGWPPPFDGRYGAQLSSSPPGGDSSTPFSSWQQNYRGYLASPWPKEVQYRYALIVRSVAGAMEVHHAHRHPDPPSHWPYHRPVCRCGLSPAVIYSPTPRATTGRVCPLLRYSAWASAPWCARRVCCVRSVCPLLPPSARPALRGPRPRLRRGLLPPFGAKPPGEQPSARPIAQGADYPLLLRATRGPGRDRLSACAVRRLGSPAPPG